MKTAKAVSALAVAIVVASLALGDDAPPAPYLIGRGKTDITGPPVGLMMLGYVRPEQVAEGIHLRQYARTFVIAEPGNGRRLAIVTAELQSVTHSLVLSVLEKLRARSGDLYRMDNVVIAATHTHAVPGGYWHYTADTPFGSPLYREHFEALVDGITASIVAAHEDLKPGHIRIAAGDVEGGGAQRSRAAYLQNPEEERSAYASDIDTQMTELVFERDGKSIGVLNWHAVHPTSMSFHNKLVSSDNKGYAAYSLERAENSREGSDGKFVAAFAQSNCGDVTPNLKLNAHGPGKDDFESTQIIGQRMADAAARLLASASEEVRGPVDSRMVYVDMSRVALGDDVTHAGPQTTSPAAYGYSFAAGSTEDGGGQPMFREGMIRQDPLVDALARNLVPLPAASAEMRRGQQPKPILIALGAVDPPALPQVLPVGVARIGQLALAIGPAEFTTTSGRRFRRAVSAALPDVNYVAIAGYVGDYAGYVATREEYQVQHYEGAATLFGPWTQLAYQQQFARLAGDLAAGRKSESHDAPLDVRPLVRQTPLGTPYDAPPPNGEFGDVIREPLDSYAAGESVAVSFWSGNPRNGYRPDRRYAIVERQQGDAWLAVARDGDWDVKIRWTQPGSGKKPAAKASGAGQGGKVPATVQAANEQRLAAHELTVEWAVPADARSGTYRVTHHGVYKDQAEGKVHDFASVSRPFEVAAPAAPAADPSRPRK